MDPARDNGRERKYRPYRKRLLAVIIAVIVIVAGFALYYSEINRSSGNKTLTVYTYSSFLAYGANKSQAFNTVFNHFEQQYGVKIIVKVPTAGLLQTLSSQKKNPQADIVIGLTNMNGVQAARKGLLVNYTPPAHSYINTSLLKEMGSASNYITPYEYSYLGIDYNKSFVGGNVFQPSFQNLTTSSNASNLLLENPTVDDTGEGFLLWEIAYYKYVLNENWTKWWNETKQYSSSHVYSSWDSAFSYFNTGGNTNLLVSYLTDTAYNNYFGYGNNTGSSVTYHNGQAYGWRTIYGVGIVNGSQHLTLDREFVNYLLSPHVQDVLPTNEWMYPANSTIALPQSFGVLPDQTNIYPLNNYITASTIADNIGTWETQWLTIHST